MQFAAIEMRLEQAIDVLLTLDAIFAGKFGADQQRLKMLAIAIEFEMLAGHTGEDELFDLIRVHENSGSQLPTLLKQAQRQQRHCRQAGNDDCQAEFRRHI